MERTRYYLRQTWNNLIRSRKTVAQTMLMMSIALFLLGLFAWLSHQTQVILKQWEGDAPILVFLKDELPKKEQAAFLKYWKSRKELQHVRLVTPAEALKRLSKSLGQSALRGVQTYLLPTTVEIRLKPSHRTRLAVEGLGRLLSKDKRVQQVDYSREWYQPLWKLSVWMRRAFWLGGLLLLFAVSLMAAGTIRLSLVLRQEEISIMRLIGATEFFVRVPFYLEGLLIGLMASILALALLSTGIGWVSHSYNALYHSFTAVSLAYLPVVDSVALLLGGGVAGLLGSWWAFLQQLEGP